MAKKERQPESLKLKVLHFIEEHQLISSRQPLLVAVSGGPDSVCLLHVLLELQPELGLRLHVAHLNHQIRGAEAEADARYVAELACRLNVSATIESRDVRSYQAQRHISLEEAAREVRYTFLAQLARTVGTNRVAVGHTVDDHVETILMHLIRGTGTRGLRGLQPSVTRQFGDDDLTIIRPLLSVNRQETTDYCRENQLMPRIDTSNRSLSPLRNRIRLELLPLLKRYNPRISEALCRTAILASDDLAFLDSEVSRVWDSLAQRPGNTIILDKERFLELPTALRRHLLRDAVDKLSGDLRDVEARHIEEIMAALAKPAGKKLNLPGGLTFAIDYGRYLLSTEQAALSPFPILSGEFPLKLPGKTVLSGWQITATIVDREQVEEVGKAEGASAPSDTQIPHPLYPLPLDKGMGLINNLFTACFDFDKTGNKLVVRTRQRGDRFQPLGLNQPKKLGEFMIDAKIPQSWRQCIPIICSPSQIIWVVGWRVDERVKVTPETRQVLCLALERVAE